MPVHSVKLVNPQDGSKKTISANSDAYIQDVAERLGMELPFTCRKGECFACAAKILEGSVKQDKNILKQDEIDAGFILLCQSWPTSKCVIETHQEEALLNL